MANPLYKRFQATATRLLRKFGEVGHLQYIGPATGGNSSDPLSGNVNGIEPAPVDVVGVVTEIESKFVDNETVLSTDQMAVLDARVVVDENGRLMVGDKSWAIIKNLSVSPASTLIVQKVAIRG